MAKFRFVKPVLSEESKYPDVKSSQQGGSGSAIASSAEFIAAISGSGGDVSIIRINSVGQRVVGNRPLIRAHTKPIQDLSFSPFNDYLLATASEDGTVRLWEIPDEGITEDLTVPKLELKGHQKKILCMAWHPLAEGILATGAFDQTIKIWDTTSGECKFTFDGHTTEITSICWSGDGSRIVSASKDKIKIFDVREQKLISDVPTHDGGKPVSCAWMGESEWFFTAGFNKLRQRQFKIWNSQDMSCIATETIDQGTGALSIIYDEDTELLYISGRGDCIIRCYEITDTTPFKYKLSDSVASKPYIGISMMSKRSVDVMAPEASRVFKLHDGVIYPVSYQVPRKVRKYHDDLFQDTRSLVPALNASDWLSGQNGKPNRVTMDPSVLYPIGRRKLKQEEHEKKIEIETKEQQEKEEKETMKQREEQKLIEEKEQKIANQPKIVRSTFYRHVFGTPYPKKDCIQEISPSRTNSDGNLIKCSSKYYGITISGVGGRLATVPTTFKGRLPTNYCSIESGSVIIDFDFSPFDPYLLGTGHEDGRVKIWKLPTEFDFNAPNIKDSEKDLVGHKRKILNVLFNNSAPGVLLSSSMDFDYKLWDIETGKDVIHFNNAHSDIINNADWSWEGYRFVSSSKDTSIKIFDARNTGHILETKGHGNSKTSKVCWLGDREKILSAGFANDSSRELLLYDTRNFTTPLKKLIVDKGVGALNPYFDRDTGVLLLAGKGETTVRFYEITDDEPLIHNLTIYNTTVPQADVSYLPKSQVDVKECEMVRMIKLTNDSIEPVQFKVPRTRKEFFQDDIFPPSRQTEPVLSTSEWFSFKEATPSLISYRPEGMELLSLAPKKQISAKAIEYMRDSDLGPTVQQQKDKVKDEVFDRIQQFVVQQEPEKKEEDHDDKFVDSDE